MKEQSDTFKTHSGAMAMQINAMEGQLTAMQDQAQSMRDSLGQTSSLITQNERAVIAAEQSIEIAQENTIYAQRAYVMVTSTEAIHIIGPDILRLKIENSGNTPANDVEILNQVTFLEESPKQCAYPPCWSQLGVIAPHRDTYFDVNHSLSKR